MASAVESSVMPLRHDGEVEVRFHGRGGMGAVVASQLLAQAAFLEGRWTQSFPFFGVERRGAPVTAFTRIAAKPVEVRTNVYEPDVVVVLDAALAKGRGFLPGLRHGGGNGRAEWETRRRRPVGFPRVRRRRDGDLPRGGPRQPERAHREYRDGRRARGCDGPRPSPLRAVRDRGARPAAARRESTGSGAGRARRPEGGVVTTKPLWAQTPSSVELTGSWRTFRPIIELAKCTRRAS